MPSPLPDALVELIAERFRTIGEPIRIRILERLRDGEATVQELAQHVGTSQQNVSKHLGALRAEGFVSRRKRGTSSLYRIADPAVLELCDRLCEAMESQLTALGSVLA
jgi:DNA-binding transcriptional ArsR family regulator